MTALLAERHRAAPLDSLTSQELDAAGLRGRLVDPDDDAYPALVQAIARGFADQEPDATALAATRELNAYRRHAAVFDPQSPQTDVPIATFATWVTELTVPGGRATPACAVSAVTVAPTHRRRGLLRSLMTGELRTAHDLGVPVAVLTASEATIYGRFGFGAAAGVANWRIDTRRVHWTGGEQAGRIDFIDRDRVSVVGPELHERTRLGSPGEIVIPGSHWHRFGGTRPDVDDARRRRAVQYRDADGVVQGLAVYTLAEHEHDFTKHTATVLLLLSATDDAYWALWRFLLTLDLVTTVVAELRTADEPLQYLIGDARAAEVRLADHQYVRILDVPSALAARSYAGEGTLALRITDPMGLAAGDFVLRTSSDGSGHVTAGAGDPAAVVVELDATALANLFLGDVSARTLASAGLLRTADPDAVDDVFRSRETPRLGFWY